ncbi:BEACH domain-containing protein lvsD [Drosophila elegans]|uniref:BEACH domain-containing protein lvsD n=1 Tax=Drosophila elegans TaxID=30023 RepID=UPI0007E6CCBA|nr:BEACH domain-containing protein lvsD [Drosophila elegans]XP_017110928.1 BEACH domain-containing protein lvsD [Drosophila elegans]XP_017110929.1 BEACH domain-containing protein lvsD [Drosophila elegans]XP_017110930.1 BEACH domain-containing protein lvsD [Drosophila elegans]
MSLRSSVEKTPTTAAVKHQQQQQQKQQQQQQQQQEHTIVAIVAGQQKRKSLNSKRSYSLSSSGSSTASLGATRSATSPLVTVTEKSTANTNTTTNTQAQAQSQSQVQVQGQSFLPFSSFSYCTDTIAAVHHQRQSYALVQKPPSLRYQGKPQAHPHQHPHQHQLLANFSPTMTSSEPSSPLAADGSASSVLGPSSSSTSEVASSHCCTNVKASITPLATQKMHRTIPSDKINLRLILVSGKTKEFIFSPSDSAGDIAQTVFDNWPEDWTHETVAKAEILRLIYQGRFLHCNVTLGALGLPLGKTTVMHLVPRDNLPEPNSQDQRQNSKGGSGRCCSTNCSIL